AGLVLGLIAANFLAWCWALQAFGDSGALMAASLLAWGYGLRHTLRKITRLIKAIASKNRADTAVPITLPVSCSQLICVLKA
ncbi:HoxN/HupN/NixA family nickel/cobalt transporter, partial [Klebsiella pneumoniae]|nr:HoxN/HupN/NixA family nickel/cobalt transporter [Klebsiella pneumoniae]